MANKANWQTGEYESYNRMTGSTTTKTFNVGDIKRGSYVWNGGTDGAGGVGTGTLPQAEAKLQGCNFRVFNGTGGTTDAKTYNVKAAAGFGNAGANYDHAYVLPGEFGDFAIELIGGTAAWYAQNSAGVTATAAS